MIQEEENGWKKSLDNKGDELEMGIELEGSIRKGCISVEDERKESKRKNGIGSDQ